MEIYKRDNHYSLQICQIINGIVFQSYNYLILLNKTYKIVNLFVSTCIINRQRDYTKYTKNTFIITIQGNF